MTSFTPWSALGGGALIGISASILLLVNGRVAGISGILGGSCGRAPRWAGIAAQLIARKGPLARGESSWSAVATISLPEPVSPRTSTLASVRATFSMTRNSRRARPHGKRDHVVQQC